ncbi:MAG TPA: hypothetical protein VMA77_29535 [Solirubrobacteraceae bacterium]|nr:hypothetical protein [Solirubrobacteraceae bacterium]
MVPTDLPAIIVDRTSEGHWEFELSDRHERVECETLEDAKRIAYLSAAFRHPCELVVRDAYHRVLHREVIDGDTGAHPAQNGREPLPWPTDTSALGGDH